MAQRVQCPNPTCGARGSLADFSSDRQVECPKCGSLMLVKPTDGGEEGATPGGRPASPDNPFPVLPAEFGRYRILKLLGRGGMGAVFLAEDTQLDRRVALKVPFFDASEASPKVERFLREARSAAALHHPNICKVYDAGQIDGRPFITMAYLTGVPLEKEILPDAPMPQARAAEIIRTIALALEHAHGKGIVHRDLKPANVMMTAGEPVVMDFGLARQVVTDPNEARLTREGGILGTPSYMAPEQVKGEVAVIGPATDVYALGVMLFELLTTRTPYAGAVGVVLAQILASPVPPVKEFRPDVDPRLDAICRKAMAKNPTKRFASMGDLANALQQASTTAAPGVVPARAAAAKKAPPAERQVPRRKPPAPKGPSVQERDEPEERPTRPVKKKAKRKRAGGVIALLVGGSALLVLAVGGVLASRFLAPRKPAVEEVASKPSTPTGTRPRADTTQPTDKPAPEKPLPVDCTTPEGLSAGEARKAQEDWAKYLERAVDEEVEIAGGLQLSFALIPPGKFLMGSPPEEVGRAHDEQAHTVVLTRPFYLAKYTVTQAQYQALTGANPSHFKGDAGRPVESVTWDECKRYAEVLTARRKDGCLYRLPTEAEWEYACRGGRPSSQPFGIGNGRSLSSEEANFNGTSPYGGGRPGRFLEATCPVGSYAKNAFGLFDMHGNVVQWCEDYYGPYESGEVKDPTGPLVDRGLGRVFRSGAWFDVGAFCRSARRHGLQPASRNNLFGFRLARSLPADSAAKPPVGPGVPPTARFIKTASGLQYEDLKEGTGPAAKVGDTVLLRMSSALAADGRILHPEIMFRCKLGTGEVIKGLDEGIRGIKVGGKRRLLVPAALAHGVAGRPPVPPNADLLYELECVKIE